MPDLEGLILSLKNKGILKSKVLESALRKIDRKNFVRENYQDFAYDDSPLPIGRDQTISQPYTVVFMLELLKPRDGEHILDAGYGSGWQTALLAEMAGEKGKVYAFEIVEPLCVFGQKNVLKYPHLADRVDFYCRSAGHGLEKIAQQEGGFDAIIAGAEVKEVPQDWRKQLKNGGRMVYPKAGCIVKETKLSENKFLSQKYPGFSFVPFIHK